MMHFEFPECKRCCLCLPLRYGILIFGYLNLIFSLLVTCLEARQDFGLSITHHKTTLYRGVEIYAQMWLPYLLYSLEIIFNVILLVGAHKKQVQLIRMYYYYGVVTTVSACLCFVVVRFENQFQYFFFDLLEFCLVFSAFVIHVYLLLLIRTELQKLKYREGLSYVNHMSEVLLEPATGEGRNPL